jgi:hypothetical protein
MILVPPTIEAKRMSTCKGCKFFYPTAGTCGTPVIGEKVTYYRNKVKLCGCIMRVKTKFTMFSCPIGKWGAENAKGEPIADEVINNFKVFAEYIHTLNTLDDSDIHEIYAWKERLTGQPVPMGSRTRCVPCLKDMVEEVWKLYRGIQLKDKELQDVT